MIRFEDAELVNMVLAGDSCIAVPFEIYVPAQGGPVLTVYSFLESIAQEYEERFSENLLSASALKWLDNMLSATVKDMNYVHADDPSHFLVEFEADKCRECYDSHIIGKSILMPGDTIPEKLDLTAFEDYNVQESDSVLCLEGESVVSVSTTNDIVFDDKSVEICVETLPDYEGRGYGTASVAALCKYYNEKGIKVKYECAKSNTASVKIAEKCGFRYVGQRYSYVCYATDEEHG